MRECEYMYRQFPIAIEWVDFSRDGDRSIERFRRFSTWAADMDIIPNLDYILHQSRPLRGPRTVVDVIAFKNKAHALQFKLAFQGML